MNKSQNQPQEECNDYLPPVDSIRVEGVINGKPFAFTIHETKERVIHVISNCKPTPNECTNR